MYKGIEHTVEQDQEEAESSRRVGWLAGGKSRATGRNQRRGKETVVKGHLINFFQRTVPFLTPSCMSFLRADLSLLLHYNQAYAPRLWTGRTHRW